jgi:iron(III) transport system ATP-binding protein
MFGLRGVERGERRRRAMECLEMVGMADLASRRPHELSGGQQQRVAIARSIAPRPRIILLDEPFSNLDPALRSETRNQIHDLLHEHGMSALLVTHDQEEALSFADRIGVMRAGRVVQAGEPQLVYTHPHSAFVAQFLGRTNLIEGEAEGQHATTPIGRMCLCCPAQGEVMLSVRPEHLRLTIPQPGQPVGQVIAREFKGHDLTLRVQCGQRTYTVQTDYACPFHVGQSVGLLPTEPAVVVDPGEC